MRIGFFIRESLRTMRRNAVPSFAAMASVLVTMLVLGVFIPIVQATTGAANEVRGRVLLDVYMKTDASQADLERVRATLSTHTAHIKKVQFISKQQAFANQQKQNPEAYALLGSNPLPDTFRITPDKADNVNAIAAALAPGGTPLDPAVDQVRNQKDQTQKILSATHVVKLTMGILAFLLIGASILLVSNTIRLSLFARRREIEVMKLVGATDWFIRWPFLLEGVLMGAFGGSSDRPAGDRQDRPDRPPHQGLRADRRAGHDQLRPADRHPDGRRGRRVQRGLGPQPAPLPAGLTRPRGGRPPSQRPSVSTQAIPMVAE